jgi:diadenylate cyclase
MTSALAIVLPNLSGIIEILVMAIALYYIMDFFRGTRSAQVMTGFVFLLIALTALTRFFNLDALNWILQRISVYAAVAFIVIFQPEIRRALAEIGKQSVFTSRVTERIMVDNIVSAAALLSGKKIGALIAVEREIGTRAIQETGVKIDSAVTAELLATIFYPMTPLHDGGVIINANRVKAAGCLFPLSQRDELSKSLGTRHRAAIGLTEETDALVVVVSEETGSISLAYRGRLTRGLDEARLRRILSSFLLRSEKRKGKLERVREELDWSADKLEERSVSGEGA